MAANLNFFDLLCVDDLINIGVRLITGEWGNRYGTMFSDSGLLLFRPSVLTRAARAICPHIRSVNPEWDSSRGQREGVSLKQPFTVPGNEVVTNSYNSSSCPEKVIMEIVGSPGQKETELVITSEKCVSFDMDNVGTGPLPLNFTDYRIKAVYVDWRMDYMAIIQAIGSTLEEIRFSTELSNDNEPAHIDWAALFSAIPKHCFNLHTLSGVDFPQDEDDGNLEIEYAALLCSYRDKIRGASVGCLSTCLISLVFEHCPNLRIYNLVIPQNFVAEYDLERTALLATRALSVAHWNFSQHDRQLELVFYK